MTTQQKNASAESEVQAKGTSMGQQLTIFDELCDKFSITKPIRLIELFAGYGSQAMASVNSNSQLYKQFGNSIVVDVMVAIFKKLNIEQEKEKND